MVTKANAYSNPVPDPDMAEAQARSASTTPDGPEMTALWERLRQHDDGHARDVLVRHYLPFARMIAASTYAKRTHNDIEFAEYMQLASLGLVEAVDRFDPTFGAQFKTFASKRVQGAILNGLVKLTEKNQQIAIKVRLQNERLQAAKEAAAESVGPLDESDGTRRPDQLFRYLAEVGIGVALGVLLEDTGMVDGEAMGNESLAPSPEVSYFRRTEVLHMQRIIRNAVDALSDQQRLVISYHYLQEISFEEIAAIVGVTRGRISQLHRQALLRLRELLSDNERPEPLL